MNIKKAEMLAVLTEISISVHFEFANFDKLIKNITAILDVPGNKLEIKMMVTPAANSFRRMQNFQRYLESVPNINLARVIVSPLRDPVSNDLMAYTPSQIEEFGDVEF
jgi:hypothetical protein